MTAVLQMLQPETRVHVHAAAEEPLLDDNRSFVPGKGSKYDEELFRGRAAPLPCGHSEAAPRHAIHASNSRCAC
jgi:hypothetical protein